MLLTDLLRLVNDGGIHSTAELARCLGINEELVASMTADLTRRGYLTALDTGCSVACAGCGAAAACSAHRTPLLAVTAKGQNAVRG